MAGKPLPTALHLLRGTARPHRMNPDEPEYPADNIKPPDYLQGESLKMWEQEVPKMIASGVMREIDINAMATYCVIWARWMNAITQLRLYGDVIESPSGMPIKSPYLSIAKQSEDQMGKYESEFGMTPASRRRVAAKEGVKENNPFKNNGVKPKSKK